MYVRACVRVCMCVEWCKIYIDFIALQWLITPFIALLCNLPDSRIYLEIFGESVHFADRTMVWVLWLEWGVRRCGWCGFFSPSLSLLLVSTFTSLPVYSSLNLPPQILFLPTSRVLIHPQLISLPYQTSPQPPSVSLPKSYLSPLHDVPLPSSYTVHPITPSSLLTWAHLHEVVNTDPQVRTHRLIKTQSLIVYLA